MNSGLVRCISLSFFTILLLLAAAGRAMANEDNDLAKAQDCLNHIGSNNKAALSCISGIEQYNSGYANLLKCSARIIYNGFDFFQFPWLLSESPEYPIIATTRYLSYEDLDKEFARRIVLACSNTGLKSGIVYEFIGEYYWLRSLLLDASMMNSQTVLSELESVEDDKLIFEIEMSLQKLLGICRKMPTNVPLPLPKTIFCVELLKVGESEPDELLFYSMLKRMRRYN